MPRIRAVAVPLAILSILILSTFSFAAAPDRISGPIASGQTVKLGGGVTLAARRGIDHGSVDPSLKMPYITMVTVPSAAQKKAATQLFIDQQNPHSAHYHKWLTPEQYANRFGLSPSDIGKITSWLQSQGFTIVRTARARNFIVFSGTAAQVEKTFQVEIDNFERNGKQFFANTAPPTIPSALSGIVVGFHGMNNFRPASQALRGHPEYTYVNKGNHYFIAPGDITAIYDLTNLYSNGYDGTGQSLAVMGQTGIYESDITNFRGSFGLSPITCSVDGSGIIGNSACDTSNFQYVLVDGSYNTISDGDLPEADLDLEWSGATAPGAKVIFVTATDPDGGGVWDSWYYAVDNNTAPVITMSYTDICEWNEAGPGTGEYTIAGDESMLQEANMEGITFMNSSGDQGVASCDNPNYTGTNTAIYGYAVAYPASSQYVTGVGGTSIPAINPNEYTSSFWNSTNGTGEGSAKGYIQEQVWNDNQEYGYLCTPSAPCHFDVGGVTVTVTSWETAQSNLGISGGGGGFSGCAFVDGNDVCTGGFPQPSWQSGISGSTVSPNGYGITTNPARMVPDVSLLASPNFPGYLVCTQAAALGGSSGSTCDSPTTGIADMLSACYAGTAPCSIFGGTSVSTPIFAGIVTLLNQYAASNGVPTPVGNINSTLYTLAASNSTNHAFNQVTTSSTGAYSNGAFCQAGTPSSGIGGDPWPATLVCPSSGASAGFLGFNAYNADPTTGYNLVTGLGSVDVGNLFVAWIGTSLASTTTTVSSSANPSNYGDSVTFTATVTTSGTDTPTGTVIFKDNGTQIGTGTLGGCVCDGVVNQATTTLSTSTLLSGSHPITAVYGGDSNNAGSTSTILTQVVNAPDFTVTNTGASNSTILAGEQTGSVYSFSLVPTVGTTFGAAVTFACSFSPTDPTLTNSSCTFSPASIAAGSPASAGSNVTVSVTTLGPNQSDGVRRQQRRRADNRLPWLPLTLPLAGIVMFGFAGRKLSKCAVVGSLCLALVLAGLLVACGGGGSSTPPIGVSVSGSSSSIYPQNTGWTNSTASFTATVSNDSSGQGVTWTVSPTLSGQSITATDSTHATYTPPTITTGLPSSVTVTATSVADSTKSGNAAMGLKPTTVPGSYTMTVTVTESTSIHNLSPAPTVTVQ